MHSTTLVRSTHAEVNPGTAVTKYVLAGRAFAQKSFAGISASEINTPVIAAVGSIASSGTQSHE